MAKSYVYVTGQDFRTGAPAFKPFKRELRGDQPTVRVAVATPAGTVELHADGAGRWSVQVGPAPNTGGGFHEVARGDAQERKS